MSVETITGLRVSVTVYTLRRNGEDYDDRWEENYSTAEAREHNLGQQLLHHGDYDEDYKDSYNGKPPKAWQQLSEKEACDWYFNWVSMKGTSVEWDYFEEELIYDIADLKPAS